MTVAEREYIKAEEQLSDALAKYAGMWVAVMGHEVVASAASLEELLGTIEPEEVEGVFQVPQGEPSAYFF